jgi:hypothetical protein
VLYPSLWSSAGCVVGDSEITPVLLFPGYFRIGGYTTAITAHER